MDSVVRPKLRSAKPLMKSSVTKGGDGSVSYESNNVRVQPPVSMQGTNTCGPANGVENGYCLD